MNYFNLVHVKAFWCPYFFVARAYGKDSIFVTTSIFARRGLRKGYERVYERHVRKGGIRRFRTKGVHSYPLSYTLSYPFLQLRCAFLPLSCTLSSLVFPR